MKLTEQIAMLNPDYYLGVPLLLAHVSVGGATFPNAFFVVL